MAQLRQRRQRETQQHQQTGQHALGRRDRRRRRQAGVDQLAQRQHQPLMHRIAQQAADGRGRQPHQREFQHQHARHLRLHRAQAAHDGDAVAMPLHEAAGRQRHGHRRNQHRQQRHQRQEALRPVQGAPHLRPARLERGQFLATLQMLAQPLPVGGHGVGLPGRQQGIADAAARRHQSGGGQVGGAQHDARRHIDELHAAIGLVGDDALDAQPGIAQAQRVAHLHAQQRQQLGVDPDGAQRRHIAGGRVLGKGRLGHPQAAAQRIARLDGLQGGQLGIAVGAGHGRELQGTGNRQPRLARPLRELGRHRLIGLQHQVGAQHLARIALQRPADPVGQEAHAGDGGHRHHQRQHQHQHQQAQLAGARVAHHHAQTQAQGRQPALAGGAAGIREIHHRAIVTK
ncbi:Uncharacterised protein [Bordetella pertussis]|nr:hypothetical protein L561_2719 [Bordetella pertussis STO1-CHOC-0019]CFD95752.1 Uncharacterised protein [Bordetella pertussis]